MPAGRPSGRKNQKRGFRIIKDTVGKVKDFIPFTSDRLPHHAMIFMCDACNGLRMYGHANVIPENENPLLMCHHDHKLDKATQRRRESENQHFQHTFVGIWIGDHIQERRDFGREQN